MYLALDPGKTNGIAHFDEQGKLIFMDQLTIDEFSRHLDELAGKLTAIIFEEFRLDPRSKGSGKFKMAGSNMEVIQPIGMVRAHCVRNQIPMWPVQRASKAEGYAWSGLARAKDHAVSHQRDAVAIGFYWLVKNRIITQGTISPDAY